MLTTTMIILAMLLPQEAHRDEVRMSVPPVHVLEPTLKWVCPEGYTVWWPWGKEFDDKDAECVKYVPAEQAAAKKIGKVTSKKKVVVSVK
jgi:hypothetical protein